MRAFLTNAIPKVRQQNIAAPKKRALLIFKKMPHAATTEMYDEAVALYAQKIATRITALYRVGAMTFPGLSDIDLLVVVPHSRNDNNQFFNVFYRLPSRFHQLFRHHPSILPANA